MRVLLIASLATLAAAFSPRLVQHKQTTLEAINSRRELLKTAGLVLVAAGAQPALATPQALSQRAGVNTHGSTFFFDDKIEQVREESQMPTGGKLDLNNAAVSEYKNFPGMYPHAAGQIASHGPYNSVADIYNIPTASANDKKMFKKYQNEFTVNPPGRMFDERINERVST